MSKSLLIHSEIYNLKVRTKKKQKNRNDKKRNKRKKMTHQNVLCHDHGLKSTVIYVNIPLMLNDARTQTVVDHLVQKKSQNFFFRIMVSYLQLWKLETDISQILYIFLSIMICWKFLGTIRIALPLIKQLIHDFAALSVINTFQLLVIWQTINERYILQVVDGLRESLKNKIQELLMTSLFFHHNRGSLLMKCI